jgi:hypothetical protein
VEGISLKLSESDYLQHLSEQLYFLKRSSEGFDKGFAIEAKQMAVTIRVLLHDTPSSTSLLTHLGTKDKIYYFNTAIPNSPFGLTGRRTTTEGGGRTEYYAPLDNLSDKRKERPWVTFNTWWENINVLSDGKNQFTRKKLVTTVANQDGGAHVDSKLNTPYSEVTRGNSLNVYHEGKDVYGVELASIRQITFELLNSLENKYGFLYS